MVELATSGFCDGNKGRKDKNHWFDDDRSCDSDDDQGDEVKAHNENVSDSNETPTDNDYRKKQENPQSKCRGI